jgi:hypothetical protein
MGGLDRPSPSLKGVFGLLIALAGAVVSTECMLLIGGRYSFDTGPLGVLDPSILTALAVQVVAMSVAAVALTAALMVPALKRSASFSRFSHLALLHLGIVLAAEGIVAVNLSAAASTTALMAGLQLFFLGALVVSSTLVGEGRRALSRVNPGYAVLLFLLCLLPAAFMVV